MVGTGGPRAVRSRSGAGYILSAKPLNGISISTADATDNVVQGNYTGTNAEGAHDLGNDRRGVLVVRVGVRQRLRGSTVRGAECSGINARVLIFSNAGLGIELAFDGVTPDDPQDPDVGANQLHNYPDPQAVRRR